MKKTTPADTFKKRFTEFVEQRKAVDFHFTQQSIANATGISSKTISSYLSPNAKAKLPRSSEAIALAKFMNTTTDYLFGLTDSKKPVGNVLRQISDYTGLSDSSIEVLHRYNQFKDKLSMSSSVNLLLEELTNYMSRKDCMVEAEAWAADHPISDATLAWYESDEFTPPPHDDSYDPLVDFPPASDRFYQESMSLQYSGRSILHLIDTYLNLDVSSQDYYCLTTDGRICTRDQVYNEHEFGISFKNVFAELSAPLLSEQYFLSLLIDELKYRKKSN